MRPVYIIAVSGGVDSVVLLHMIASRMKVREPEELGLDSRPPLYVVAHVDHGIREDSGEDSLFVQELAKRFELPFEGVKLELGKGAGENIAREKRYEHLLSLMKKYKAEAVITAHHQDDVIETMIVNLLRGTGARGLIGFSQKNILRPLLNKTKKDLLQYAKKHRLIWREDSTNADTNYLRNDIRRRITPKLGNKREELLKIRARIEDIYLELDDLTKKLLVASLEKGHLVRTRFVVLPYSVQKELMACWLRIFNVEIDKPMIEKATISAKTLLPGKHVELAKNAMLYSEKETLVLKV